MKTVVFTISHLKRGGPPNVLYDIIKNIDRHQYVPVVLTLKNEMSTSRITDFSNLCDVYCLDISLRNSFMNIAKYRRKIQELNPNVVHSHGIKADFLNVLFTRFIGVSTLHCLVEEDYKIRYGRLKGGILAKIHRYLLRKLNVIVAVNSHLVVDNNTTVVFNGADTTRFLPITDKRVMRKLLGLPEGKKIIGFVGHLNYLKNTLWLATELCSKLSPNDYEIVFVGDGDQRHDLEELKSKYSHFKLTGFVKNVEQYVATFDLFVSASRTEGFPLVVLEALAAGVPVALSNIPAHRSLFSISPKIGFLFSINDDLGKLIDLFFSSMQYCVANDEVRKINKQVSSSRMTQQYEEIYNKVIGTK